MNSRDQSLADAKSTSARIRILAAQGMSRADIARALDIRYQHVRSVLVAKNSKSREEVPSPTLATPIPAAIQPSLSGELLLTSGFVSIGCWGPCVEHGLTLDGRAPDGPGVYAFVVDGSAHYVGVTQRGLKARLDGYRRGYERQRTNARVKALLLTAIEQGRRVEVLIAAPPASRWNGLPVDGVAGLEYGLIREFRPPWNVLGTNG